MKEVVLINPSCTVSGGGITGDPQRMVQESLLRNIQEQPHMNLVYLIDHIGKKNAFARDGVSVNKKKLYGKDEVIELLHVFLDIPHDRPVFFLFEEQLRREAAFSLVQKQADSLSLRMSYKDQKPTCKTMAGATYPIALKSLGPCHITFWANAECSRTTVDILNAGRDIVNELYGSYLTPHFLN